MIYGAFKRELQIKNPWKLRTVVTIVTILVAVLALSGCAESEPKQSSDFKKEALADAKINIEIIKGIRDDPKPFEKALTGNALTAFSKEFETALAENKIKVRKYEEMKFKTLDGSSKKLVRLRFSFIDNSYLAKADDPSQSLTIPIGEAKQLDLHLERTGKKWKISMVTPVQEESQ